MIESLRDEVPETKQRENNRLCPTTMDADEYTSQLVREISEVRPTLLMATFASV